MVLKNQLLTWLARLLISYQITLSYLAFEDIDVLENNDLTKVAAEEHDVYLYAWCLMSMIHGILTFVGVKAFCEPEFYTENNVYYEILDLASRAACLLCWIYYFIVCFAWIHYGNTDVSAYALLLGLLLLIVLACTGEINISGITIILAVAHICVSVLTQNPWGAIAGFSMIVNGLYLIDCDEPSPLCYWPTLISMCSSLISSIFIISYFQSLSGTTDEVTASGYFAARSLSLPNGVNSLKKRFSALIQ